jgi:hypothetical protein
VRPQRAPPKRRTRPTRPQNRPPKARLARAAGVAVGAEAVVDAGPQATKPNQLMQTSLRRTKPARSMALTPPLRASAGGAVVVGGGEKRPLPLQTTRRTLSFGYASLAGKTPATK